MIDAIGTVVQSLPVAPEAAPRESASTPDFARMVGRGLDKLDGDLQAGDRMLRGLAAGEDIPLHDVMIAMEQAQLRLRFAVEVRNRLVESYQQLTQMQL